MKSRTLLCGIGIGLLWGILCHAKVLIITHAFNRPEFISLQHKTFKKFVQDKYEFVVFCDAKHEKYKKQIEKECKRLRIRCIPIPQEIHTRPYLPRDRGDDYQAPSIRTGNVVQYSLDILGFDFPGTVVIIDSDMFLVRPMSFENYIYGKDMAAVFQTTGHVKYIWNGIVIMNMKTMPNKKYLNFNPGMVDGRPTDTGGYSHYYFKENPSVRVREIEYAFYEDAAKYLPYIHRDRSMYKFLLQRPDKIQFFAQYSLMHYRSGANWNRESAQYHARKGKILTKYINGLMYEKVK